MYATRPTRFDIVSITSVLSNTDRDSQASGDATAEHRSQVTQWLTYWVLYALIDAFECVFDAIGIPFFDLFKLVFLVWLFAPNVNVRLQSVL